jgi:ubiquinone/menaquinone biosynthesis C-methylase UbiE
LHVHVLLTEQQDFSDRHLVELAKINPNSRVLDIATGIGEPAITAAKKIRTGNGRGHVLAMDMSPQMLSIAKQRASSLDLVQVIEFRDPIYNVTMVWTHKLCLVVSQVLF